MSISSTWKLLGGQGLGHLANAFDAHIGFFWIVPEAKGARRWYSPVHVLLFTVASSKRVAEYQLVDGVLKIECDGDLGNIKVISK